MTRSSVIIRFQFPGIHRWAQAPAKNRSNSFLFYPHRHLFRVIVEIEVADKNRQIEFFECRQMLMAFLLTEFEGGTPEVDGPIDLGEHSCEMVADKILQHVVKVYDLSNREAVSVEVQEDDESSGKVTLTWQD